jgi:DNA-binding NarL/FixJ family response regulator
MYKEIADQLCISMSTVRSHVCAVYDKLHVHSRTQAAKKLAGES